MSPITLGINPFMSFWRVKEKMQSKEAMKPRHGVKMGKNSTDLVSHVLPNASKAPVNRKQLTRTTNLPVQQYIEFGSEQLCAPGIQDTIAIRINTVSKSVTTLKNFFLTSESFMFAA